MPTTNSAAPGATTGQGATRPGHLDLDGGAEAREVRAHAPRRVWQARYVRRLVAVDYLAVTAATLAAFMIRFQGAGYARGYLLLSAVIPLVWLAILAITRAYEPRHLFVGIDEYQRVLRAAVGLTASTALASYLLDAQLARGYLLVALVLTTSFSLLGRLILRKSVHHARRRGAYVRRVLVLGHAQPVAAVTRQLHRQYYHGLQVVGACLPAHEVVAPSPVDVPVYGTLDAGANAATAAGADTVIVLSCPELDGVALRRLGWDLERDDIDLIVSASLLDIADGRITVRPIDGLPMMHIEHPCLSGGLRVWKSMFDVATAAVLLLVLAPVFAVVGLLIKLDTPGPALFRQRRVGRHGAEFEILKFRTMRTGAEQWIPQLRDQNQTDGVLFKMRDDPRVSRVGGALRRYSLDELPQLINVLLGQMSLVGPRPPLPAEVASYPADMRRRLLVKPGMTGLWQVSGRSDLSWEEAMRLDLRYVENWSLTLDILILVRTSVAVLRGAGAY